MRRIRQSPSPGIAGQSLSATPLTTSWRRYTAHRNTGLRRCSIARATLVLSTLVRSSGPQSSSANSCHPILVSKISNSSVHVKLSLHLGHLLPRATRGHLQAVWGHIRATQGHLRVTQSRLRAITGSTSGHLHHGHSGPLPGHSWFFTRLLSSRLQRSIFPVCPLAAASSARHQAVV